LAIALVADPDLLVLDEPTAALDVEGRREFWPAIRARPRRRTARRSGCRHDEQGAPRTRPRSTRRSLAVCRTRVKPSIMGPSRALGWSQLGGHLGLAHFGALHPTTRGGGAPGRCGDCLVFLAEAAGSAPKPVSDVITTTASGPAKALARGFMHRDRGFKRSAIGWLIGVTAAAVLVVPVAVAAGSSGAATSVSTARSRTRRSSWERRTGSSLRTRQAPTTCRRGRSFTTSTRRWSSTCPTRRRSSPTPRHARGTARRHTSVSSSPSSTSRTAIP